VARSLGLRWLGDSAIARQSPTGGQRDPVEGGLDVLEQDRVKQGVRGNLLYSRE
jgi:hypothetical protein